MVQIDGTYQFIENLNAEAFLKAAGSLLDEKALKMLKDTTLKLTVKLEGNKCTVSNTLGSPPTVFTFGQPFDDVLPFGNTLKTVATRDGNKITLSSDGEKHSMKRVYEFTDTGLNMTFTHDSSNASVTRVYKRL